MKIDVDGNIYNVEITYKNIKNMYLRVSKDLIIKVTAPKIIKEARIKQFIEENLHHIAKEIREKKEVYDKKKDKFEYLGNLYDICYTNKKGIELGNKIAFIGKNTNIDNWYKMISKEVFKTVYDNCYKNFKTVKSKPELKIRKMKGKWGVCNITNHTITLNQELIKLNPKYLEYVIYHELCHLKHPDHSKNFWNEVSKYTPDYKQIKKEMKNT